MKNLDTRLIVLAGVLVALGGVAWRQSRLSDELTELREVNSTLRALLTSDRFPGRSGPVSNRSEGTRSEARREADPVRATNALRDEVDALRAEQIALREKLAEAAQALQAWSKQEAGLPPCTELDLAVLATDKGPRWSPEQIAGPPDTFSAADLPTAWASNDPDGGAEWLHLDYDQIVDLAEVRVHESFNPGAISKVTAVGPDGSEKMIWEGILERQDGSVESVFDVPPGLRGSSIRIYLDTTRVKGWNEIDAVEVVGRDGSRQWANGAQASSYYGEDRTRSGAIEPQLQVWNYGIQ